MHATPMIRNKEWQLTCQRNRAVVAELVGIQQHGRLSVQRLLRVQHCLRLEARVEREVVPAHSPGIHPLTRLPAALAW